MLFRVPKHGISIRWKTFKTWIVGIPPRCIASLGLNLGRCIFKNSGHFLVLSYSCPLACFWEQLPHFSHICFLSLSFLSLVCNFQLKVPCIKPRSSVEFCPLFQSEDNLEGKRMFKSLISSYLSLIPVFSSFSVLPMFPRRNLSLTHQTGPSNNMFHASQMQN